MSTRGIVMESKGNKLIVLTEGGSFRKIRRIGGEVVGQEVLVPALRRMPRMPIAVLPGAAAILLLLSLPIFWTSRADAHPVVAYLSLDINPSFEIGVDSDLNVRQLTAMNADAAPFVDGMKFRGLPAAEVIGLLAGELAESSYLQAGQSEVILAGVKLNEQAGSALAMLSKQAEQALLSASGDHKAGIHVTSLESTEDIRKEAAAKGISLGRMTVYLLARTQGYDVDLEQFRSGAIHNSLPTPGGMDALLSMSRNVGSDKLQEQLLREQQAALRTPAPSSVSPEDKGSGHTEPDPSAKPAADSTLKPSVKPQVKPLAKPDSSLIASPSSKPAKVKATPTPARATLKPSPQSNKDDQHGHHPDRTHKQEWEQHKQEWEKHKQQWEKRKQEREQRRQEWEKKLREAENERKQLAEKLRKAAEERKKELEQAGKAWREKHGNPGNASHGAGKKDGASGYDQNDGDHKQESAKEQKTLGKGDDR